MALQKNVELDVLFRIKARVELYARRVRKAFEARTHFHSTKSDQSSLYLYLRLTRWSRLQTIFGADVADPQAASLIGATAKSDSVIRRDIPSEVTGRMSLWRSHSGSVAFARLSFNSHSRLPRRRGLR